MAKLTAARRKKIPKSQYGLPAKAKKGPQGGAPRGAYPMPDKEHAKVAKAYAKREKDRGNLSVTDYNKIVSKANRVLKQKGAKTISGKPVKRVSSRSKAKK